MVSGPALEPTRLGGLSILRRHPFEDDRGSFDRLYETSWLGGMGGHLEVAQINHSVTRGGGTVRGLHYQVAPFTETKLVACLRGRVFDVAVDLRRGSPTFLSWHGQVLSAEDPLTLVIPHGFAHGFQVLSDECELLYVHSEPYELSAQAGVHPNDPRVDVRWPEPIATMSSQDRERPLLAYDWIGVES